MGESMTQQDVVEMMKNREKEWWSNQDIADELGVTRQTAAEHTRRLRKFHFVEYKLVLSDNGNKRILYAYNERKEEITI